MNLHICTYLIYSSCSVLIGEAKVKLESIFAIVVAQKVIILLPGHLGVRLDPVAVEELCENSRANVSVEAGLRKLVHLVPLFPELVFDLLRSHVDAFVEIFEAALALIHLRKIDLASFTLKRLAAFVAQELGKYALIAGHPLHGVITLVSDDLLSLDRLNTKMTQKLVE